MQIILPQLYNIFVFRLHLEVRADMENRTLITYDAHIDGIIGLRKALDCRYLSLTGNAQGDLPQAPTHREAGLLKTESLFLPSMDIAKYHSAPHPSIYRSHLRPAFGRFGHH